MNVLSLFDGMSCGRIALERASIEVHKYYASELDKHAIKVTQANWSETTQLGDVTKWYEWDIDWSSIDLLIGGSPCQGFSFAGKQLAFDDPRSKLFFVYLDILEYIKMINPNVKFMLENVKMKKEYLNVISNAVGVEPVFINSASVSGCARPRYYWFNWSASHTKVVECDYLDFVVDHVKTTAAWNEWWCLNKHFQTSKFYSKIVQEGDKGLTMTARQYASWNGNYFIIKNEICKPGKKTLALLVGASESYFDATSQRQAELMAGNGWTVDVIAHIFKALVKSAPIV